MKKIIDFDANQAAETLLEGPLRRRSWSSGLRDETAAALKRMLVKTLKQNDIEATIFDKKQARRLK